MTVLIVDSGRDVAQVTWPVARPVSIGGDQGLEVLFGAIRALEAVQVAGPTHRRITRGWGQLGGPLLRLSRWRGLPVLSYQAPPGHGQ